MTVKAPVVFTYEISWDEALYQGDNNKGWIATKSNDSADQKQYMTGMVLLG